MKKYNKLPQLRFLALAFVFLGLAPNSDSYTEDELEIASQYFKGTLKTTPFATAFRASEEEDVPAINKLSEKRRKELMELALASLMNNEGVISVLAAGASTRMNPLDAPEDVKKILGFKDIKSKASVPLGIVDDKVYTFLGAFLINLARLQEQIKLSFSVQPDLRILILSNDDYRPELDEQLQENNFFGLKKEQLIIFHQELGNQMIATKKDALALSEKLELSDDDKKAAVTLSEAAQEKFSKGDREALMLAGEKAPLGHGEFLHQMISSGTFLKLYDEGRKWISVRNIDNSAATFDENWLVTLGLFLARDLDMQPEVSPRTEGQKGGSLIVSGDNQILAEDPQIAVSSEYNLRPERTSYWFNDAVAIFSLDYMIDIYQKDDQSKEEFINELRQANDDDLLKIAARGRKKFPVLMDPKPAKTSKAIAMKVETNMWQSTGVVSPSLNVRAVGVQGIFNIKDKFDAATDDDVKNALVRDLRFLATKQWVGPAESYEANKAYIEFMLRHITEGELFPQGLKSP